MRTTDTHQISIIRSAADISAGTSALRRQCRVLRKIHDATGDPPLRREPDGFSGLAGIIVSQQLSAASANAIWRRLSGTIQPLTPAAILATSDDQLRQCGVSGPKIRTLRATARAIAASEVNLARLARAPDEEIHKCLTSISGIGPWTADIYLMFCLGRADSWAAGDLALQIAAQRAFVLEVKPSAAETLALAERWRPWRGVAARLLWHYYAWSKANPQ